MGLSLPIVYFQSAFILRNSVFWRVNTIVVEKTNCLHFRGVYFNPTDGRPFKMMIATKKYHNPETTVSDFTAAKLQLLYLALCFPKEFSFKETVVMGYNYLRFSED